MNYIVVGINHKTASVAARELLAQHMQTKEGNTISELLDARFLKEATIVSTCNRYEFYGTTECLTTAQSEMLKRLAPPNKQNKKTDQPFPGFYIKQGKEVVEHLFSVASSLDSQLIGETEITGQVKRAYSAALENKTTGFFLNKLFERAFFVAKRVKSETKISHGNISLGSAAVGLAKKIFDDLCAREILLLGTGEIGKAVLSALKCRGLSKVFIVNRTLSKAENMETQGYGMAIPLEKMDEVLSHVDIIITATSVLVDNFLAKNLKKTMEQRKNMPLFLVDLGIPRNIDPNTQDIDNAYLYNLDDLKIISEQALLGRENHIKKAKNIIDEETGLFYATHLKKNTL
jgi:glutamyl-tRNA reductase